MYKLPVSRTNLGRLYNIVNSEAIDEDQIIVPKEVAKKQFEADRVMDETMKPPSKIDQKTAFTIDLYINNINDEINESLEITKQFIIEIEQEGESKVTNSVVDIISDWNKLVIYLKSFEKSENISVKEKDYIWERLTTEALPNLVELIEESNYTDEELGKPTITPNEYNKLLELEENINNKRFAVIKGLSKGTIERAEERDREKRREGEKDAKFIENYIRKGGLVSKEELLKQAFSEAEIEEIQRKLDEIKGLQDKNQRDNLRDELLEQITKRVSRGAKGEFFGQNLKEFRNRLESSSEEQIRRTQEYLQDLRTEAENNNDSDLVNRLTEKLRAVGDEYLKREGLDRADLEDEGIDDIPDFESEFYVPPSGPSSRTGSVSSTSTRRRGRPRSVASSSSGTTNIGSETTMPTTEFGTATTARRSLRGRGKPLLNKVMEPRYKSYLNANEKNRNALPFDDKSDDPYYILRKMNIH